ncbi:MAG TPA: hydrogenase nickel incorporation protein HypB [Candidatus Obscuribacterales bacterium]
MHEKADGHALERLLADNEQLAEHNREHFDEDDVLCLNFMSAPGAGKTTLIEKAIGQLKDRYRSFVIEGDMVGELDADRLKREDIEAFQISTGKACHLDAAMVARVLHNLELPEADIAFIENVGNLVCPAEFPLGEHLRVVLLSVTEGADKPLKYPVIFHNCDAVVLTKCDLLPYVDFDRDMFVQALRALNHDAALFEVSAKSGSGLTPFVEWIVSCIKIQRSTKGYSRGNKGEPKRDHVHLVSS